MASAEICMGDLVRQLTIHFVLTGVRRARIHMWLGTRIMLLGGRICGCDIEMVVKRSDGADER